MDASGDDSPGSPPTGFCTTRFQYRAEIKRLVQAVGAPPIASPEQYSICTEDSSSPNVPQTTVGEGPAKRLDDKPSRYLKPGFTRVYSQRCEDIRTSLAEKVFPQLTSILDRLRQWMQHLYDTRLLALPELMWTLVAAKAFPQLGQPDDCSGFACDDDESPGSSPTGLCTTCLRYRTGLTRVYSRSFSGFRYIGTPLAEKVFPKLAHVVSSTSSTWIVVHDTSILDELQQWMQHQYDTLHPALLKLAPSLRGKDLVRICREVFGDDYGATSAAQQDLAYTLFKQGKVKDAARMLEEVLDPHRRCVGINLTTAKIALAVVYSELGRLDEAEQMQNDVLETCRQDLGDDHPDTITAMNNLAITLERKGRYGEALSLQSAVLESLNSKYGPDNLQTASAMSRTACTLRLMHQTEQAEEMYRLALKTMQRFLPSGHPDLIGAVGDLGNACQDLGWTQEAEAMLRQALEMSEQTLGEKHPKTVMTRNNLGCTLLKGGKSDDATKLLKTSLEHNEEIWGRKHVNTVETRSNLAEALSRQDRNAEAVQLWKEAWDDCRPILGDGHPLTVALKKKVTNCDAPVFGCREDI
ncbi:TPR-like protein [Colletotrichum caudatum]|nr:TPR-like protein [Colletotrichum caudatum]